MNKWKKETSAAIVRQTIERETASKKPKTNPIEIRSLKSPAPVVLLRKVYTAKLIRAKNKTQKIEYNSSLMKIEFCKKNDKNK